MPEYLHVPVYYTCTSRPEYFKFFIKRVVQVISDLSDILIADYQMGQSASDDEGWLFRCYGATTAEMRPLTAGKRPTTYCILYNVYISYF